MKFASLIAVASAVKLTQKSAATPGDIVDHCDSNGNGRLSKAEFKACVGQAVPKNQRASFNK
jgi:hypothetical protein